MKFLKKAGVFLLAAALIPSFSAFAETSQSYVDNLNKYTEDKTMSWSGYGNSSYPSDVFVRYDGNYGFIDADGGYDGTAALQMTQYNSGHVTLKTRTIDFGTAATPVVTLSYDFKIIQNAKDDTKLILIGADGAVRSTSQLFKLTIVDGTWKFTDAQNPNDTYAYTLGNWYRFDMVSDANGAVGKITDLATNSVVIQSESSAISLKEITALYMQYRSEECCSVMLDNVILTMYDAANDAPEIVNASVETDSENVPRNQELTFTFDQQLDDSSTVTFAKKDGTPVDGARTEKTGYNTVTVTYDGLLEKGTEYVLSFDEVTNGTLNSPDSAISFTTENLHLWNDVEVSSAAANEDDADLTDITFTIGDEYGYPVFSGSVMAAVYQEGKMIALDMQPLTNADTGEITVSFDLGTVPADAKIGLILLDVEHGPIPLSGGTLEN